MTDWKKQRFALINGIEDGTFSISIKRRDELLVEMCLQEIEEHEKKQKQEKV